MILSRVSVTVAALNLAAVASFQVRAPNTSHLMGFSPSRAMNERQLEQRFRAGISVERMSEFHRAFTRRPHMAGTPAALEIADTLRRRLDEAGLETETRDYHVWLSSPKRVSVQIVEPVAQSLDVSEPADSMDPDSAHPDLGSAFVAYSASSVVRAPVVYVNYGLPADYARLAERGLDARGKVAIARYARSHRAVKVHTAQQAGAVGIIIYSDPADDGVKRGAVWPEGPWRAPFQMQRGNGKYSWFWHGDPLSPGFAATADARLLDPSNAPTLPRIPAVILSSRAAFEILRRLTGPEVPSGFAGGLPLSYRVGPGPVVVKLDVEMDDRRRLIRNVLGRIRGRTPDRSVLLGTHHDAWTFGGVDPGGGLTTVFEVARGLAALKKDGWTPERSIVFAFWDAEEFGLIGSTEYAEQFEKTLREKAIAYINTDLYMRGRFDAGGTPSFRDFLIEVAKDVPSFSGQGSVYDGWRADALRRRQAADAPPSTAQFEVELAALGSGADFVAFQDYLGLPTLQMEFDFDGSYGAYHSNYDTRWYVERFADPGFTVGATLVEALGRAVMRLADAEVLPLRYSHYGRKIRHFLDAVETSGFDDERPRVKLDLVRARDLADQIASTAAQLEQRVDRRLAAGTWHGAEADRLNDRLARLEQALLDLSEPANRRWYRHVIYGWNIYSLYEGQPLPGLAEAIRLRGATRIADETARIERALERMLAGLRAALR